MSDDVVRVARLVLPPLIVDARPVAVARFLEVFAARIANRRTRAAYGRAVGQFLAWCAARGLGLTAVTPLPVAAYIRTHPGSAPTVKQHLAAIRMLGDWLVVSQVIPVNPAAAVRGPKHRCLHGSFMTGQTYFCFAVQIVDIQGLDIRPKRVRLELGAHTAEPFPHDQS